MRLLSLLVAISIVASASAQVAQLRVETATSRGKTYRLYIRKKKTDLTVVTSDNVVGEPTVDAHQTRKGIIYGSIDHTESGAVLVSEDIAFIQQKGNFIRKNEYSVKAARGETLLLVSTQTGPWDAEGDGLLYRDGKFVNIGTAHDAGFGRNGTIVGWYYANEDGTKWGGLWADRYNVYKQYFEYRDGVRKLKGKLSTE